MNSEFLTGQKLKHPLYVKQSGTGPNLVLLHGWGLHGDIFQHVVNDLAHQYCVFQVDLPGFGQSVVDNDPYTLEYVVEKVLEVTPENAHWLGWSFGGLVAMAISSRFPERVKSLITVTSTPRFVQADDWPDGMSMDNLTTLQSYLIEDFKGTLIRFLAIQALGSKTQQEDLQQLKELTFRHGEPAPRALKGGLEILELADLREEIKQIAVPWLRLYGRRDSLVSEKSARAVDILVPDSKRFVFENSSHAPFISEKNSFVTRCIEFLA